MTAAVECRALERGYGSLEVLRGLDMEVGAGSIYGLLGPSGCGKTTDGWVLLRPSNPQPVMRMFIEARTPERLVEIRTEFTAEYEKTLASLSG